MNTKTCSAKCLWSSLASIPLKFLQRSACSSLDSPKICTCFCPDNNSAVSMSASLSSICFANIRYVNCSITSVGCDTPPAITSSQICSILFFTAAGNMIIISLNRTFYIIIPKKFGLANNNRNLFYLHTICLPKFFIAYHFHLSYRSLRKRSSATKKSYRRDSP